MQARHDCVQILGRLSWAMRRRYARSRDDIGVLDELTLLRVLCVQVDRFTRRCRGIHHTYPDGSRWPEDDRSGGTDEFEGRKRGIVGSCPAHYYNDCDLGDVAHLQRYNREMTIERRRYSRSPQVRIQELVK